MKAVQRLAPPFAFAGLAVADGDGTPVYRIQTSPGLSADEATFWRAASISKIVVGQTLRAVVPHEALHQDISDLLGWQLRNPAHLARAITLAQIMSHTSSLDDAGGYLIPEGLPIKDWMTAQGDLSFSHHAPGAFFNYCNLGYIIAATTAEAVAGERFDTLAARHVLRPMGIEAGFNWSGLSATARRQRLPTYRRDGDSLKPQIDDHVAPSGISGPDGLEAAKVYELGRDVARLSPQGGLRLTLEGAVTLARGLRDLPHDRLWHRTEGPGEYLGGLMQDYGWGLQYLDAPPFYPRPLIGHFANAYGLAGGVWYDPEEDRAFAYALNGLPMDDESDALRPEEQAIFDAVA